MFMRNELVSVYVQLVPYHEIVYLVETRKFAEYIIARVCVCVCECWCAISMDHLLEAIFGENFSWLRSKNEEMIFIYDRTDILLGHE